MRNKIAYLHLIILFICEIVSASEYTSSFNRQTEFPSYLAEGSTAEKEAIRNEIEQILKQRFSNMTVPVPTENGYERVRFIEWATNEAKQLGLGNRAQFYPSGGLIRNNVTEIYEQVHAEKRKSPSKSVLEILKEVRSRTPNEIFHTQIRGVGSDFDILIGGLSEEELKRFNTTLETKITKFEKSSGLISTGKGGAGALKKSFVLVPDFKDVTAQITRATGQGGLEGDFLFFDMQEGRLKDPPQLGRTALAEAPYLQKYSGASDRLLSGKIQYHSAYNPDVVRAGEIDAQTVRALRTLSEAPWTTIDDLDNSFVSEMRQAIQKGSLSPKAQEQLTKMVRNSRFGGGANRFVRLSNSASEAEKLIYEFREKYPDQFRTFLARSDRGELGLKFSEAPEGLKKALMQSDALPSTLYHGVPSVDALPSVARNGLILSTTQVADRTTAVFGDGAYSSENYATAKGYSRDAGIVIPIQLEKDAKVIDWSKVDSATRRTLETEAAAKKVPLNLYLHDQYGVQAIKNQHFMILDMAAVENPVKNYSDILKFYAQNIKKLPAAQRSFTDVVSTLQIAKYAEMSGEPGVEALLNRTKSAKDAINWERMLSETFGRNPVDDLKTLATLDQKDLSPTMLKRISQKIEAPSFKRVLSKELWSDSKQSISLLRSLSVDSGPVGGVVQRQLKTVLEEGSRLRTEIIKNPMGYAELISSSRVAPAIKEEIRKTFSLVESSKSIEAKILTALKEDAQKGLYYNWSILNELPESLSKKIFSQLPYSSKVFDKLIYNSFQGGKITNIGRLLLDKDTEAMKRAISSRPNILYGLSATDLDHLSSKGIPVKDIGKSIRPMIVNGELTDSAKWLISKSPKESLPKIYNYEVKSLKKGSDVSILIEAGYPKETVSAASNTTLKEIGAKVKQHPDGTTSIRFSNAEEYRSQSIAVHIFKPSFDLEALVNETGGDPQKLDNLRNSLKEQFAKDTSLKYKVTNQLQGALVSKNTAVKEFAQDLLRENADMRSTTAKASLISRRKDIFAAIPLDPNNTDDQKLLKELGELKDKGSKGIVADHAKEIRAAGNPKPSGSQISKAITESRSLGKLELARAMEEMNFTPKIVNEIKVKPRNAVQVSTERPSTKNAVNIPPSSKRSGCVTNALEMLVRGSP